MLWILIAALACTKDEGTDTNSGQDSADTVDTGVLENTVFMTCLLYTSDAADE